MGTMDTMTSMLRDVAQNLPDPRSGTNKQYSKADIVLSGFACFWTQSGSFLQFQRRIEDELQVSNMKTLFGVNKIPTDDQIRNFLDEVDYKNFSSVFYSVLQHLKDTKALDEFKVLNNKYYVIALDGSLSFVSKKIKCDSCIVKNHRNSDIDFSHTVLYGSLVTPNSEHILPLHPEFNLSDDSDKKQDCEQKQIKRWFEYNLGNLDDIFGLDRVIILTDDLHSHHPLVDILEKNNMKYILNCKEDSHKTLTEFVNYYKVNNKLEEYTYFDHVSGLKDHKKHTCQWLCGLPLRDHADPERVNWFSLTIENAKKCKIEVKDETNAIKNKKKQEKIYNYIS
jgi:hypothetical protein